MTILVASLARDGGCVVGADSVMSLASAGGMPISAQSTRKIRELGDKKALFLHSGDVGIGQLLSDAILSWVNGTAALHKLPAADIHLSLRDVLVQFAMNDALAQLAKGIFAPLGQVPNPEGMLRASPMRLGSGLVVCPSRDGAAVVSFEGATTCTRLEANKVAYIAHGSGEGTGNPFLEFVHRVLWGNSLPDLRLAKLGVCWTIRHAIKHGTQMGVGGTPHLAFVGKDGDGKYKCDFVSDEELESLGLELDSLEQQIIRYDHDLDPGDAVPSADDAET